MLQIEFDFVLPKGYIDGHGNMHREGTMRLSTAIDEIAPMRDPRVRANESYLTILLLSRVITRLGTLPEITAEVIESLFTTDLAYLQDLYCRINQNGHAQREAICPSCNYEFELEDLPVGG
jgi:hypothetical protein